MNPHPRSAPASGRFRDLLAQRLWLGVVLLAFSALVVPTLGQGIGSWDGHKILLTVQTLLEQHRVMLSRPPGHPTTDFYLFGTIGWMLDHGPGRRFDSLAFLTTQWIVAVSTALVFHHWLARSGISRRRAALATACLLFSPQFLAQTLDGEEFIHGILFLLGAVLLLLREDGAPPPRFGRLAAAAGLLALATGCRPELAIGGAAIFALCFLRWGVRDWKIWLGAAAGAAVMAGLVWLPILATNGLPAVQDANMDDATKLLGWGYKMLFSCFGFPTSLLLGAAVAGSLAALCRRKGKPAPEDYTEWVSLAMVAIYLGLFLLRPHKPAYVLVCLPFLLWLAARRSLALLVATTVLTVAGLFVGFDIFRDRVLSAPRFVQGAYAGAVAAKSARQTGYIAALSRTGIDRKSAIIGNAWEWVYLDLIERRALSAERTQLSLRRVTGFVVDGDTNRILLPRESLWYPDLLQKLHEAGYQLVMDRMLWRTAFAKYDITTTNAGDMGMIGSTPVRLISVVADPR